MKEKLVIAFFVFAALFILITGAIHDISAEEPDTPVTPVECSKEEQIVYENEHESEEIESAIEWHYIDDCTLTAYCPCESCCGEYTGLTATGTQARYGICAVDEDVIPLGAWVEIDGQLYRAEDTGAFSGNHVDIYFSDHSDALKFGIKHENIRWMHDDF